MYSRPWGFGVLCSVVFMFILTACQSATGKVSDGSFTPGTVEPQIADGSKVTVQYVLIAPAFTATPHGYVREFIQGRHQILPALEHEVTGMKRGEEKQIELPEEVFGPHDDTKIVTVPKGRVPAEAKEGDLLESANGELVTLAEVSDTRAVLDYNHPLAGKQVVVQVKILKVEDP